ncbi:MAG: hypothetical protein MR371_07510 [Clostridia bacterium]|nr:hypothetical protein [Clostridia bacterium]
MRRKKKFALILLSIAIILALSLTTAMLIAMRKPPAIHAGASFVRLIGGKI